MVEVGFPHFAVAFATLAGCLLIGNPAFAGEADVIGAEANCASADCTVVVTVRHDDSGWDHYADHWRILTPVGEEIGRRVLLHPHDNEQPFTRSLSGVQVPPDLTHVIIEAHDSVHDYGGSTLSISLQPD